jgi:hypothetical protein
MEKFSRKHPERDTPLVKKLCVPKQCYWYKISELEVIPCHLCQASCNFKSDRMKYQFDKCEKCECLFWCYTKMEE